MKNSDPLLKDILATGEYPAFRAKLRDQLRHQLRRRRFQRNAGYLALAACVVFLVVIGIRLPQPPAANPPAPSAPAYLVQTQPLAPAHRVQSAPQVLARVRSERTPEMLQTATQPVSRIGDDELLSLFPGTSVVLIAGNGGPSRLVFLDPEGPQIQQP